MASARPYRARLPLETVPEEFRRGRGVQWDDQIADEHLDLVNAEQIAAPGIMSGIGRGQDSDSWRGGSAPLPPDGGMSTPFAVHSGVYPHQRTLC